MLLSSESLPVGFADRQSPSTKWTRSGGLACFPNFVKCRGFQGNKRGLGTRASSLPGFGMRASLSCCHNLVLAHSSYFSRAGYSVRHARFIIRNYEPFVKRFGCRSGSNFVLFFAPLQPSFKSPFRKALGYCNRTRTLCQTLRRLICNRPESGALTVHRRSSAPGCQGRR